MAFFYSDDFHAGQGIQDAEVFWLPHSKAPNNEGGWYFWFCRPGFLPDSDEPWGPFETEESAIHACKEMVND